MDALHPWTERLSGYLDGDLPATERAGVEAHLDECGACRATLEELRTVVAAAGALEDRPPDRDLWPGIAQRIATEWTGAAVVERAGRRRRRARRFTFSLPQLAAAGVALMLLSGGAVWFALSGDRRDAAGSAVEAGAPAVGDAALRLVADRSAEVYDRAVADLERILDEGRDRLDPATIRVLEENLRIIDAAIEDGRRAVAQDPGNVYLNNHLAESMKRKLQLLRRASGIVTART